MNKTTTLILKALVILVPLLLLQYVVWQNYIASHDFVYEYDIGSDTDANTPFLTPLERVSEPTTLDLSSVRNLNHNLVYFDVELPRNAQTVTAEITFKDEFTGSEQFSIGAKDDEEWSYAYHQLYAEPIESVSENHSTLNQNGYTLIGLGENQTYDIVAFQENPPNKKLITDTDITLPTYSIKNYQASDYEITTPIRGTYTFYVYAKGSLAITAEKRDLNWYDNEDTGPDTLTLEIYDLEDNLLASTIIEDDGEDDKDPDKENRDEQIGNVYASNLEEGVYKVKLVNNDDMIITRVHFNHNKVVVADRLYLAGSDYFFTNFQERSKVYFETDKQTYLRVKTYHKDMVGPFIYDNVGLDLEKVNEPYEINVLPGTHTLSSKTNDIILEGPLYFAFDESAYFDPFEQGTLPYKPDVNYLQSADYILVRYTPVEHLEGNWKKAKATFDVDDLYLVDNKANFVINTPHLNENNNQTQRTPIAIDKITITVHKPGLIEQWK